MSIVIYTIVIYANSIFIGFSIKPNEEQLEKEREPVESPGPHYLEKISKRDLALHNAHSPIDQRSFVAASAYHAHERVEI